MSILDVRFSQRVFISSTFLDMHAERDLLINEIEPLLNAKLSDIKVQIDFCDFRWGLDTSTRSADEVNQFVFDSCFSAIESSKPIFIGLIGHRYGWVNTEQHILEFLNEIFPGDAPKNRSVTEYEIRYALQLYELRETEVLFLFRDLVNPKNEILSKIITENDALDKVNDLKNYIINTAGSENVIHYEGEFQEGLGEKVSILKKEEFINSIADRLEKIIREKYYSGLLVRTSKNNEFLNPFMEKYEFRKLTRGLASSGDSKIRISSQFSSFNHRILRSLYDLYKDDTPYLSIYIDGKTDNVGFSVLNFIKYCCRQLNSNEFIPFSYFIHHSCFNLDSRIELAELSNSYMGDVVDNLKLLINGLASKKIILFINNLDALSEYQISGVFSALKSVGFNVSVVANYSETERASVLSPMAGEDDLKLDFLISSINKNEIKSLSDSKVKFFNQQVLDELLNSRYAECFDNFKLVLDRLSRLTGDDFKKMNDLMGNHSNRIRDYQILLINSQLSSDPKITLQILLKDFFDGLNLQEKESLLVFLYLILNCPIGINSSHFKRKIHTLYPQIAIYIFDVFIERYSTIFDRNEIGHIVLKNIYIGAVFELLSSWVQRFDLTSLTTRLTEDYILIAEGDYRRRNIIFVSLIHRNSRLFDLAISDDELALIYLDVENALFEYFYRLKFLKNLSKEVQMELFDWILDAIDSSVFPILLEISEKQNSGYKEIDSAWKGLRSVMTKEVDDSVRVKHRARWAHYYSALDRIRRE